MSTCQFIRLTVITITVKFEDMSSCINLNCSSINFTINISTSYDLVNLTIFNNRHVRYCIMLK